LEKPAFPRIEPIMISQTVEYALRAIVTIAQHEGQTCTARKISDIAQVPSAYLSKLMQNLVRGGLVRSQRGLNGGFVLNRDPKDLTIWEVVDVIEPMKRIATCPLGIQSHAGALCPLHAKIDRAIAATEKIFRETTIAELLSGSGGKTPLCEDRKFVTLDVCPEVKPHHKAAAHKV
jgi:Rrf2 family transcriptional regulator, nitric oxide-sensitive transcriptional repressor